MTAPYSYPYSNPTVVGAVEIQVASDLTMEQVHVDDYFDAFALTGGIFMFLVAIFGFVFNIFMGWLMHLEIVRVLFRVDPTLGKKKKSR